MSAEWPQSCVPRNIETTRRREQAVLQLAARQHQVVRADQLEALGLHRSTIGRRVAAGRLHKLHPRVLAVHPPPYSNLQRLLAAIFACGPRSLACDLSAAAHLGFAERHPSMPQVTSPTGAGRQLHGITVRRRTVDPQDIWYPRGIPCTSAARTVLDCASFLDLEELELVLMAADASGKLNRRRLDELLTAHAGRRGIANLRLLTSDAPADTRSVNERRMRSVCREFGVAQPLCNHRIEAAGRSFVADFCWPDLGLIVEAASWRWHGGRLATERDADRDQLLAVAGWRVIHFTRDQILDRERTGRRLLALTAPLRGSARAPRSSSRA